MNLNAIVSILAIIMLFLFGLQSLSLELQRLISGPLKKVFTEATNNRFKAMVTGIFATGIIQSSSAVTALAVTLIDSGVLSLNSILSILIGSNIGTASTAFLVSLKLEFLGAYLIVMGSILSLLPIKVRVIGKSIFYFGFVLFLLDEMGSTLQTQFDPEMLSLYVSGAGSKYWVLVCGIALSALFQSSSLITGLAVLMVSQGLVPVSDAVYLMLGANVGTTSTALIASLGLKAPAKKAAIANLIFNMIGVLIVFPFATQLAKYSLQLSQNNLGMAVAYSHLIFNVTLALIFLPFVGHFAKWLEQRGRHTSKG